MCKLSNRLMIFLIVALQIQYPSLPGNSEISSLTQFSQYIKRNEIHFKLESISCCVTHLISKVNVAEVANCVACCCTLLHAVACPIRRLICRRLSRRGRRPWNNPLPPPSPPINLTQLSHMLKTNYLWPKQKVRAPR